MRRIDVVSPRPSDAEQSVAAEKSRLINIQAVLREFDQLENFELYRVGKSGWILRRRGVEPAVQHALALDLDDFMVKTLETKGELVSKIKEWLESIYTKRSSGEDFAEAAKKIFRLSDAFARWADGNDQETTYHVEAQSSCLGWLMKFIHAECMKGSSLSEALTTAETKLRQVEKGLALPHFGRPIQTSEDASSFKNQAAMLIRSTISDPIENPGVTQAIENISKTELFSIGFLSGGDPVHQLRKILTFLSRHPSWPVQFIGLSESNKGEFLIAAEQLIASFLNVDFANTGFSHVIQLDDSPLVAKAVQEARGQLEAMLVGVNRFKLPTGKFANADFLPTGAQDAQTDLSHHLEQDQAFITQFEQKFWQWYWLFCVSTLGIEAKRTNQVQDKVSGFNSESASR